MPDLLLELFSEEIPARMQAQGAKDLERLVVGALTDRGMLFDGVKSFAGPRRLTLAVHGIPAKQSDVSEERKGPRVGAPEKAIEGFLKSAGVSLEQCQQRDEGKGPFYVAVIARKGRPSAEVLAEILPEAIGKLPWPKSMRWGSGAFRWVRPLHSIVATLDGEVASFEAGGVMSGHSTHGHRFLAQGRIEVKRFDDYAAKLRSAHVILDAAERREIILHEAKQKAFALGLELIADEGLLSEVAGLAEWPVVLVGDIDAAFMDVPPEVLQTSMRVHQKYFSLRDPAMMKLANKFVVVAGMVADDGGKDIVAGNERVLRARLSDAKFFWDQDRKRSLDSRVADLEGIVFHAKLGTQLERVKRIESLAGEIAKIIGADVEKAQRAAFLCKADLTTGVVGEFPELQGIMGRYYAFEGGEDHEVANAIRDHYKPLGPSDAVAVEPVSIAVALADKLDTLVGFFANGEKPTGSGDPYALRRAALGVVRLVLENNVRLSIGAVTHSPIADIYANSFLNRYPSARMTRSFVDGSGISEQARTLHAERIVGQVPHEMTLDDHASEELDHRNLALLEQIVDEVHTFFADRLKVALREKGIRHDLIDAVFALGNEDDLVRLVRRVEALQAFLKTDDGASLLVGYRRAANILRIEEKKDKRDYRGVPDGLKEDEEIALQRALTHAKVAMVQALKDEEFAAAMRALASLRVPVDRFFDKVTVNAEDKVLRENRLRLLSQIVETAHHVADFSKVEG